MGDFKLTLSGEGINVERTVDRSIALAVLNSVLGAPTPQAETRTTTSLPPPPPSPMYQAKHENSEGGASSLSISEKPTSLREFINGLAPKTNAQIILCIASFLSQNEATDRFSKEKIKPKFAAAGEQLPKNFSRDFQTAIDKGWVGEDPQNRDLYYVTRTGEAQISSGFGTKRN